MRSKGVLAFFVLFYLGMMGVIATMMIGAKYEYEWKQKTEFPKLRSSITIAETFEDKLVLIAEKQMLLVDENGEATEIELNYVPKSIVQFNETYYLIRQDGAIYKAESFEKLCTEIEPVYESESVAFEFFLFTNETLYAVGNAANGPVISVTTDGVSWTEYVLVTEDLTIHCGVMKDETIVLGGVHGMNGALIIVEDLNSFEKEKPNVLQNYSSVKTLEVIGERLFVGCAAGEIGYMDDFETINQSKIENAFVVYDIVKYHERIFAITSSLPNAAQPSSARIFYSADNGETFTQGYEEAQRLFVGRVYADKLYVVGETGRVGSVYTIYKMKEGFLWQK